MFIKHNTWTIEILNKYLLNEQTGGMPKWKGWSDVHLSYK